MDSGSNRCYRLNQIDGRRDMEKRCFSCNEEIDTQGSRPHPDNRDERLCMKCLQRHLRNSDTDKDSVTDVTQTNPMPDGVDPSKITLADMLASAGSQSELAELRSKVDAVDTKVDEVKKTVETMGGAVRVEIVIPPDPEPKDVGLTHHMFAEIAQFLKLDFDVMAVGPTGSGKTHMCEQMAKVLGVEFFFTSAVFQKYELTGYNDANGRYVETDFYKAFAHGGVFLFDEMDISDPAAIKSFNMASSNNWYDFPCGRTERHPDCYLMGAANTWGTGATKQYVGNQLDGSTRDRFLMVTYDYDEKLEYAIATKDGTNDLVDKWIATVQGWRKNLGETRHIISPRASIAGAKLLLNGIKWDDNFENMVVWKGLEKSQVDKIKSGRE